MANSLVQRSFAAGEISPALYARTDFVKYQTGLRTLRNAYVLRHGGTQNRAGTKFLAEVKDSTKNTILIPFIFSSSQAYMLEFGNLYMRVIKNDAYITNAAQNITAVTQANPAQVTVAAHGLSTGDEVFITGVVGMTELNGRNFKVVVTGANTFTLQYLDGSNVDSTGFTAYSSGGTIQKIYELVTPYLEADLDEIRYTQSADVMTLTHQSYEPRDLSRFADDNWTLTTISFRPATSEPTNITSVAGGAGGFTYVYAVTAIDKTTREESLQSRAGGVAITGITQANPAVVTAVAHGYSNGDLVEIRSVTGMTQVNNRRFIIAGVTANTFQLQDINSTGYTAYAAGGTAHACFTRLTAAADRTTTSHIVTWTPVANAAEYNIYLESNGVFYYISTSTSFVFTDRGATPNTTKSPPRYTEQFIDSNNPAVSGYYQQRKLYGNFVSNSEQVQASRTGQFKNFSFSTPLVDDDSVSFSLASTKLNEVKSFISLEKLILFTENGVFRVDGNDAGVLTPFGINPVQVSYIGSSSLSPLIVGDSAVYVQARGSVVRDLNYQNSEGQKGMELSLMSAHLVDDYQIDSWTYQEIPHSLIWAVRNDGILLCITYVKDQQIVGWSHHDFENGFVEHIASIPSSEEDAVYMVIRRTINGRTVRYVERFASRKIVDIVDNIFVDSALSYDGRNTTATTMTLSGGTNWDSTETLTLNSSSLVNPLFSLSDVGNQIHLYDTDGSVIRFTITGFNAADEVTGKANRTVPVGLRSVAVTNWAKAVDTLGGLWHLEGQDVSVFADGYVEASAFNPSYVTQTVTNGQITLTKPYSVIHVGLPYITDIETLDVDSSQGESISTKKMSPSRILAFMEKSRGGFYGLRVPTGANPIEGLQEIKIRNEEEYDQPVDLLTGKADVVVQSEWNKTGRVFIRQIDPIPMTILSIVAEGLYPIGGN